MDLPSTSDSEHEVHQPELVFEPSQTLYDAVLRIICNEVAAPNLLPYSPAVGSLIEYAKTLKDGTALERFRAQRILQVCAIYTAERVQKIEATALFRSERLSPAEQEFAKRIGAAQLGLQRRLLQGLRERVGADLEPFLVEDMKKAIQLHRERCAVRKVFAVFTEDGAVGEARWRAGECALLEYGAVQESVIDGRVAIYGFVAANQ